MFAKEYCLELIKRNIEITIDGPKDVYYFVPNKTFWSEWSAHKEELKEQGYRVSKLNGKWIVAYYTDAELKPNLKLYEGEIVVPDGLKLRPYQEHGVRLILGSERLLLGDDLGLGKTIQAITAINTLDCDDVIIVAPAFVSDKWYAELKRWLYRPRDIYVNEKEYSGNGVYIYSYEHAVKLSPFSGKIWDYCIFDEAHYLKNSKAQRTQSLIGRKGECIEAKRYLFMTGTPALNRPSELWPLVKFIDPEGIGKNWYSFHLRYCNAKQNKYGWDVSGACNLEELNSLLCSRIMVRRRKGDVASDIPQKERVLVTFPVESPTIASILQEEKEIINKIRSYVGMGAIRHNKSVVEASYYMRGFSKINKQIAVASIPTYGAHINKILSTTNDQIVIFGRHIDFVQMMGRYLNLPENNIVHGALRVDQRSKIAESFRNGDIRVLVATIASLGVGVDLITYDRNVRVIFCEYPWQPGLLEQAEDRVCRIGQKGNVIVEYLLIEKSFFHRVFNFILNKNKTTSVISDGQQKDFKLKQKSYNLDCFIDLIKECDKFGSDELNNIQSNTESLLI